MATKRLGADPKFARQEYLKSYLVACVRDSVLSWSDFTNPRIVDKILKVISTDAKTVLVDLGKTAGSGLLRTASNSLVGIFEDVVAGRRPR